MANDTSWLGDTSWLDDLDETTNLDFSYDPSTAGIFSFNPDAMVFDDLFDTSDDSFSGDWLTDLEQSLDNPFDFSYDPSTAGQFDFNVDDMVFDDDADFLKELYPDLYPEIDSSIFEMPEPETGIFGGTWGPWLNKTFTGGEGLSGLLSNILGGSSSKKSGGSGGLLGGLTGLLGGGDSGILSSDLGKILLARYLSKQDESPAGIVPIGQAGFGAGGQGLGSMPDYRIFNLQPALMPGVGYANAPPPEMKHGGLASLDQGPGDITLARLEPGEFVMTRKATDNIGAKNLYRLMKEAERMV